MLACEWIVAFEAETVHRPNFNGSKQLLALDVCSLRYGCFEALAIAYCASAYLSYRCFFCRRLTHLSFFRAVRAIAILPVVLAAPFFLHDVLGLTVPCHAVAV